MSTRELLRDADHALGVTIASLADDAWPAASLLPGWSRGHVVAHLALNAEALSTVLTGVMDGVAVTMYPSVEARDDDIAALAPAPPAALHERWSEATSRFAAALDRLDARHDDVLVERTPGSGRTFRVGDVVGMRLREVEIHHADLGAGRTPSDWSPAFAALLLDTLVASGADDVPCVVHAADLDQAWTFGTPGAGPTVSGSAADLGWWLTGRGDGDGLTSDSGVLPHIPDW